MTDEPPPPGPAEPRPEAVADGRDHAVDGRAVTLWRLTGALRALLFAFASLVALAFLVVYRPFGPRGTGAAAISVALFVAAGLVLAVIWPPLSYRRLRWRVDPAAIYIHRGVLWRSAITVPRSRVQHTDVSRGPLERAFGLASLVIHTAGTDHSRVKLAGLRHHVACAIQDFLLAVEAADGR